MTLIAAIRYLDSDVEVGYVLGADRRNEKLDFSVSEVDKGHIGDRFVAVHAGSLLKKSREDFAYFDSGEWIADLISNEDTPGKEHDERLSLSGFTVLAGRAAPDGLELSSYVRKEGVIEYEPLDLQVSGEHVDSLDNVWYAPCSNQLRRHKIEVVTKD
jgi:hypothetical protein